MRKLLALMPLVLLVGCKVTWSDPRPVENPEPPPAIIARGTDGINEWACELKDLNPALAWVQCDFRNNWSAIAGRSTADSCIQVRFFSEQSSKLVVESRKICSGPLRAGQISYQYVAFQKEKRDTLRQCGELLDLCVMLAGPANEM